MRAAFGSNSLVTCPQATETLIEGGLRRVASSAIKPCHLIMILLSKKEMKVLQLQKAAETKNRLMRPTLAKSDVVYRNSEARLIQLYPFMHGQAKQ